MDKTALRIVMFAAGGLLSTVALAQDPSALTFDVTCYAGLASGTAEEGNIVLPYKYEPAYNGWIASPAAGGSVKICNGLDVTVWARLRHVMWSSTSTSRPHGWLTWYGDDVIEIGAGHCYEGELFAVELPQVASEHRFDVGPGELQRGEFTAEFAYSPEDLGQDSWSDTLPYSISIDASIGVTPELSTWALLICSGLAALVMRRRRCV
ncbi:MAG: hypothetical protein HPY69_04775 [Armatimonadetes bacterium]|nr:hypothetical protein [Armatimonadota bacterium]